jgi:hypothetical protein
VEPTARRQPGRIDVNSPTGGTTMLQRVWFWLFALYTAAALPLFAWSLANVAS